MGQIKPDLFRGHLDAFPHEEELLKPFLSGFDVTWAGKRVSHNTALSLYFLRPEQFVSELFGFEHELALFVSNFPTIEPRTMQAIDGAMNADPARGRVEQGIFFLASSDVSARQWVNNYTASNPQARIPIVFNRHELEDVSSDSWLVRNILREQLFSRDLFDYQLPLDSDFFFFGRDQIVADHLDAIRRSQNRGLFGLRKTGKTSILYKIRRQMERESIGTFLYYDCKLPSIRMQRWWELLERIIIDVCTSYSIPKPKKSTDPRQVAEQLLSVLRATPSGKITALVFDEIEYISPLAIEDSHWHSDFVPFWQTLWAAQSQVRCLSNTVVGVNPTVVEVDQINEIQNPMFGIFQPKYLKGLDLNAMKKMIKFFGKRMGLTFQHDAIEFLYNRYGGHPLLTRLACSEIHQEIENKGLRRPHELTAKSLQLGAIERDNELSFYCRHVVSELRKFYPLEYELLEMLAEGLIADAMDFSNDPELTRHLKEYGLLSIDNVGKPSFAIPVVGQHIGIEIARRERRKLVRATIAPEKRNEWVRRRTEVITRELRDLVRLGKEKSLPVLYDGYSFPEAERFLSVSAVSSNDDFVVFINVCNRCLVEAVENYGKIHGIKDFFWKTIKSQYPDLWDGLQRVKIYRHNDLHLDLLPSAEAELRRYIETDLEGRRLAQVPDVWFVFQQSVLDGLLLGVQCELNRYS